MNSAGVFFLAFLTSVVTAVSSVYVIERYQLLHRNESVSVPNLRGLTEAEARANLHAVGLVYLSAPREVSSGEKPGTVARQSIPPGQPVPRDHPVTIALAEAVPKVPSIVGLTETEALLQLTRAGYRPRLGDPLVSVSVPQGQIAEQTPKAEAPLGRDQEVAYRVSAGQALVEMPKLIGKSVNTAKAELETLGLTPSIRWTSVAETATFVVLTQKPEAKSQVKTGSEVDLVANR